MWCAFVAWLGTNKSVAIYFIIHLSFCGGHVQYVCGGPRTTCRSWFSLTFLVLGNKLILPVLVAVASNPLSHLSGLIYYYHVIYIDQVCVCVFWSQVFLPTMGYRDQTQVVRHMMQALLAAEPSQG